MKIVVVGTRGIPEIQGGVETHCQELYPRLAAMGHDVTVICRSCYISPDHPSDYKGVKLVPVYAPRRKSVEAIVHTALALLKARRMKPDVVHIHAVGPALLSPLARLLGLKVVFTNHGPDYDRQKWGRLARTVLRRGERMGARYANEVIVISKVIADIMARNYGRTDCNLIFNGVNAPAKSMRTDYIEGLGLEPGRYIVAVGRFVKEKGFHDLIAAFRSMAPEGVKLVIAGDADHPDAYSAELKAMARATPGVVLTGFIRGEKMNQLMTNAALFAMPSYHEGLPIALLEAMSYGLDVAVSDIPANRLAELSADDFFQTGNTEALAALLRRKLDAKATPRHYNLANYNWNTIACQTAEVYAKANS